jgi:hypothetical protein
VIFFSFPWGVLGSWPPATGPSYESLLAGYIEPEDIGSAEGGDSLTAVGSIRAEGGPAPPWIDPDPECGKLFIPVDASRIVGSNEGCGLIVTKNISNKNNTLIKDVLDIDLPLRLRLTPGHAVIGSANPVLLGNATNFHRCQEKNR